MAKAMTKREFLEAVKAGQITDEIVEYAKAQIVKLDETNAKRTAKKNAEQSAVDELVLAKVTNEAQKASAIKDALNAELEEGQDKYSLSKITSSLRRLVADGKVKKDEVRESSSRIVGVYYI